MSHYSIAQVQDNWCMDFTVKGSQWLAYKKDNYLDMAEEYPGITQQPQTCGELGFTQTHISPLYNVQKRTFTDPKTKVSVTNSYWEKPSTLIYKG